MKLKLGENLPGAARTAFTDAGHDVDTVIDEGLTGAADPDVVAAATAQDRILITLDRGLGDIRAYPPATHSGIIVLRLPDQSAPAAVKATTDLAALPDPAALAGSVTVMQRGLLRIRHP